MKNGLKFVVGVLTPLFFTGVIALHSKGLSGAVDDGVALFKKVGNSIVEDGRRVSELASAVKFLVTGPADLLQRQMAQATTEQNQLLKTQNEKMRQQLFCDVITREDVTGPTPQTDGEKPTCER